MKRSLPVLLAAILLFSMFGCTQSAQSAAESTSTPPQTAAPETIAPTLSSDVAEADPVIHQQSMTAVSVPMLTVKTSAEDGTDIFTYTYPSMSLVLQDAEVADKIILDFLNRVDTTASTAQQLQDGARAAYNGSDSWIPYMCRVLYEPMRIDTGVLSLFGSISTYSGGMHPDHTNISASYDLLTGDVLTLGSIMHKDADLQMFCKLVTEDLQSRKDELYLFEDFAVSVDKRFQTDESRDEEFYFTSTGLCFYFSPYEIAPYSSGTIVSEIPYEKLIGVIHDSYFPPEHILTDGTVEAAPYEEVDMEQTSQISEAVLTHGGQMYLLTPTNSVENIRLTFTSDNPQIHEYVFFAAAALAPGGGIMVEATQEELDRILVSYENCAGTQNFSLIS